MKLFAWLFKVITSTNCVLHFPSLFHSFYYHLHPFPPCPLHQKARKPTGIEELSNRAKLGTSSLRGSKVARPCHFEPWTFLSFSLFWCEVGLGFRFPLIFTSPMPATTPIKKTTHKIESQRDCLWLDLTVIYGWQKGWLIGQRINSLTTKVNLYFIFGLMNLYDLIEISYSLL